MLAIAVLLALSAPQNPPATLPAVDLLLECRQTSDPATRLACYDEVAADIAAAHARNEIRILDRAGIEASRRSLFGFPTTGLGRLLGPSISELEAVETELQRANRTADGKWSFFLGDGSQWLQIDSGRVEFDNRAGEAVRVRRAALGSYLLTVGGSRAVRVRRW